MPFTDEIKPNNNNDQNIWTNSNSFINIPLYLNLFLKKTQKDFKILKILMILIITLK